MRTKRLFAVVFVICVCFTLQAFPSMRKALSEMTDAQIEVLLSGDYEEAGTIDGHKTSVLMPAGTIMKDLAQRTENLENAFSVALTSFIPYPGSFISLTEGEKYLAVFNMAQQFSTLKGIEYISYMAGDKPEVLFSEAYLVESAKSRKRIADPVSDTVPQTISRYAWMKDSRFGGNLYKVDYMCYGNEIFLEISNVNPMKYMGVKCLDSDSLHLYLDATLVEEGVVISALSVIYNQKPQVKALFVTVDLPSAFMKRICSLKDWFIEKITSV